MKVLAKENETLRKMANHSMAKNIVLIDESEMSADEAHDLAKKNLLKALENSEVSSAAASHEKDAYDLT